MRKLRLYLDSSILGEVNKEVNLNEIFLCQPQQVIISTCCGNNICHSRAGGNPVFSSWIPAFAGMTLPVFAFRNRYYIIKQREKITYDK
jgi:hypothetical protein